MFSQTIGHYNTYLISKQMYLFFSSTEHLFTSSCIYITYRYQL